MHHEVQCRQHTYLLSYLFTYLLNFYSLTYLLTYTKQTHDHAKHNLTACIHTDST